MFLEKEKPFIQICMYIPSRRQTHLRTFPPSRLEVRTKYGINLFHGEDNMWRSRERERKNPIRIKKDVVVSSSRNFAAYTIRDMCVGGLGYFPWCAGSAYLHYNSSPFPSAPWGKKIEGGDSFSGRGQRRGHFVYWWEEEGSPTTSRTYTHREWYKHRKVSCS